MNSSPIFGLTILIKSLLSPIKKLPNCITVGTTRPLEVAIKNLSSSIFIPGVGVYLSPALTFRKLETVGLSSLEILDRVENKNRIYSHTLTCYLPDRFNVANRKLCFLLTAISGERYLIGTDSRPYPVVTFTDSRPESIASQCAVTMLVTYSNTCFYTVLDV